MGALRALGLTLTDDQDREIQRGQGCRSTQEWPFDLNLVFAPDGIGGFEDGWQRRVDVEGFPVCHLDDIIASKAAANRQKDREALPRLRAFREYWISHRK